MIRGAVRLIGLKLDQTFFFFFWASWAQQGGPLQHFGFFFVCVCVCIRHKRLAAFLLVVAVPGFDPPSARSGGGHKM